MTSLQRIRLLNLPWEVKYDNLTKEYEVRISFSEFNSFTYFTARGPRFYNAIGSAVEEARGYFKRGGYEYEVNLKKWRWSKTRSL